MGLIGGHSIGDTTRRIMKALITNELAKKLNYKGRGEKFGVCGLKLLDVIFGDVQLCICIKCMKLICYSSLSYIVIHLEISAFVT